MKRSVWSMLLVLVLSVCVGAGEQAPAAKDAPELSPLEKLDADRATFKSLHIAASIKQPKVGTKYNIAANKGKGDKGLLNASLEFSYANPRKYRSEISVTGLSRTFVTISDGKTIHSYDTSKPAEITRISVEEAIESVKEKGPSDLLTVLATPSLRFSDLFSVASSAKNEEGILLEVTPSVAIKEYDRIFLQLDASGTTPLWAEARQGEGKKENLIARVKFDKYERNAAVDESKFAFVASEPAKK